jgi:hypothetical protein
MALGKLAERRAKKVKVSLVFRFRAQPTVPAATSAAARLRFGNDAVLP